MITFPKIFKVVVVFCAVFPFMAFAGDEEVPALIERADSKPYTDTGAQLPVFRQQLAKLIDLNDELEEVTSSLEGLRSDLAVHLGELQAVRSTIVSDSGSSFLVQCKEILYYVAFIVCFIWGSVLHISFIQRR